MTLFLGGPRHGEDVDVALVQSLLGAALNHLPPSYVDIGTATTYVLRPVTYVTPHPLTGQPDKAYLQQVYVHETVTAEAAHQMLPDAVLRRWFVKDGTLQAEQPAVPS